MEAKISEYRGKFKAMLEEKHKLEDEVVRQKQVAINPHLTARIERQKREQVLSRFELGKEHQHERIGRVDRQKKGAGLSKT